MTIPNNPISPFTPFLPTTWDLPKEQDRIESYLVNTFSLFADVVNDKKIGAYTQTVENLNGEKWLYITPNTTRNGYQAIAYIPSYPNTGNLVLTGPTYPVPNVNPQFVITMLYGTASKPPTTTGMGNGDFFQFNNKGDSRISFIMSDTTITITTTTDLTAYSGFIVVHYLRNGF